MATLKWQDAPEQALSHASASSAGNPWFGIAMALVGVIVGYVVGLFVAV